MITDYDLRQLKKMDQQIVDFQKGSINLASLIGDLEFLLNAIESIDQTWKKKFDDEIFILEEVYADILDKGVDNSDSEGQALVGSAIEKIQGYIDDALSH